MPEATLKNRQLLHRGRSLEFRLERVLLPNGNEAELELVIHPGAAAVLPFVSAEEILLLRQYRWATSGWIYEIPAGKLNPGEDPAVCAARELEEEVGRRPGRLESLGWIWTTPGFSNERIHLFAAYELTPVPQALEKNEVIEVIQVPLAEVLRMAQNGELRDGKSLSALLLVLLGRMVLGKV